MATFIKLKQTPIKEIIFTISFKENVDEEKLEAFKALPQITKVFPIADKGYNTQLKATIKEQPTAKVTADGFILRNGTPHNKLLQARKGSISLHIVNGYENFQLITDEFAGYWNLLNKCGGPLTVNVLAVRYLNFIEIKEDENIDELININTKHPFGNKIHNTFTQHSFVYEKNPKIEINVVMATGKSETKDGIILDIILNKKADAKNGLSFRDFAEMREIKNDLFFKAITEKTIKRYNE